MGEGETSNAAQSPESGASTNFEGIANPESLSILQKALFLAVIIGCIAVYLRMKQLKQQDNQGYEKSLA